jgi:hypothetical protein
VSTHRPVLTKFTFPVNLSNENLNVAESDKTVNWKKVDDDLIYQYNMLLMSDDDLCHLTHCDLDTTGIDHAYETIVTKVNNCAMSVFPRKR